MRILLVQVPTSHLGAGERVYPLGLSRLSSLIPDKIDKWALDMNLSADPWADLNVTPITGLQMGISLNANDNDSPGTAVQEMMKSHVISRTLINPLSWGRIILR